MKSTEGQQHTTGEVQSGGTRRDSPRRWFRIAPTTVLIAALLGLIVIWASGIFNSPIDDFLDSSTDSLPKDGSPAFVATQYADWTIPPNTGLKQYFLMAYWKLHKKFAKKKPLAWSSPPSPVRPCSIHGLLNQCMGATGTRYLIAREALGLAVMFGHTNTLNGVQWVAAFEQALRDDGLLIISNKSGLVKVIPKDKLADYREAGLVKAGE